MGVPALTIMDGTNDPVHLINKTGNVFYLRAWQPAIIQPKGGGVWQDSPIADGRELVDRYYENAIETFEIAIADVDADALYWETQNLRRYLERAVGYWRNRMSNASPVYLRRKAACETGYLYAHIYNWATPNDNNPFANPFLQASGKAVFDDWTLIIERGDWRDVAPGTDACIEVVQTAGIPDDYTEDAATPGQSSDDGYILGTQPDITNTFLPLGSDNGADSYTTYIVFDPVAVPQGATIVEAYVRGRASANDSDPCAVTIFGQDSDDAATLAGTYLDMYNRPKTSASVDWGRPLYPIENFVLNSYYNTPDITAVVQEIVNRTGWATGQAMCIILEDNGSSNDRRWYSQDGTTDPVLNITYVTALSTIGRVSTCTNEGYLSNKHAYSFITHIYVDNGGVFGANLVDSTAYSLAPAAIADGDHVYFGIEESDPRFGPFDNLIFDIGVAATYGGPAYAVWAYWDGAAWSELAPTDHTSPAEGTEVYIFGNTGVRSVHWEPPSDWDTTSINGVTALWVRVNYVMPGGGDPPSISTPTQQNRRVYTCNWPYVKVEDDKVNGELSALARLILDNESDQRGVNSEPKLWSSWLFAGLRAESRGADFSAFINLSDEQVVPGITASIVSGESSFVDDITAPTGRAIEWDPLATSALTNIASVSFGSVISTQYYGRYRLLIRGRQDNGSAETGAAVQVLIPSSQNPLFTSETKYFQFEGTAFQILDFGEINFPGGQDAQFTSSSANIFINALTVGATTKITLQDIILMPIDEWSGDFLDLVNVTGTRNGWPGTYAEARTHLEIDSASNPRKFIESRLHLVTDSAQITRWRTVANGPIQLAPKADQKLWVLSRRNLNTAGTKYTAEIAVAHRVQLFGAARYFGGKGEG